MARGVGAGERESEPQRRGEGRGAFFNMLVSRSNLVGYIPAIISKRAYTRGRSELNIADRLEFNIADFFLNSIYPAFFCQIYPVFCCEFVISPLPPFPIYPANFFSGFRISPVIGYIIPVIY
jgi:hypothetical protein